MSRAERQLYLQFFHHLGIMDDQKTGFLASLLRNVFDACSKLDMHLAPHGAAVHAAVSRMVVPTNPRDAPSYRWIRVVDRVGYFSDADSHAVRLVNMGLSYAYRFLEADAVAASNATLLDQTQQAAACLTASAAAVKSNGRVRTGGVEVAVKKKGDGGASSSALPAHGALPSDGALGDADEHVTAGGPRASNNGGTSRDPGGAVGDELLDDRPVRDGGVVVGGRAAAGRSLSEILGAAVEKGRPNSAGGAAQGRLENAVETPVVAGGVVVSVGGSRSQGASAGGSLDMNDDPLAGLTDIEDDGSDADVNSPAHVIHENQPHVLPSSTAVEAVGSVLRTVSQRRDDTGKGILRKLLIDSLLCLVRTEPGSKLAGGSSGGSRADWTAVNELTGRWWPMWKAPDNHGRMPAPAGTVSSIVHKARPAQSSRWIVLVNMEEIRKSVEELAVQSSRFFPKMQLPSEEPVMRVHYAKPLRLTLVVASMLLLSTKEERFPSIMARLAAAGRSVVPRTAGLSAAARHEFFSTGLGAPTAATSSAPATAAGPMGNRPTNISQQMDTPSTDQPSDVTVRMEQMEVTLAEEGVRESSISRIKRVEILRLKAAARAAMVARAASPPSGSTGPGSLATNAAPRPTTPASAPARRGSAPARRRTPAKPRAAAKGAKRPRSPTPQRGRASSAAASPPSSSTPANGRTPKLTAPRGTAAAAATLFTGAPASKSGQVVASLPPAPHVHALAPRPHPAAAFPLLSPLPLPISHRPLSDSPAPAAAPAAGIAPAGPVPHAAPHGPVFYAAPLAAEGPMTLPAADGRTHPASMPRVEEQVLDNPPASLLSADGTPLPAPNYVFGGWGGTLNTTGAALPMGGQVLEGAGPLLDPTSLPPSPALSAVPALSPDQRGV